MSVVKFYAKEIIRNPLTIWLLWFFRVAKNFAVYRKNNIRISGGSRFKFCDFEGYNFIGPNTVLLNVKMGRMSYVAHSTRIVNANIGRFCSIGMQTLIGPGRHPLNYISSHPFFYSPGHEANNFNSVQGDFEESLRVEIGNDVWIGAQCIILDGVKIGDGAIVAADSVVTKDVEPYSIVGGTPAKYIKSRFSPEEVERLQKNPWWERSLAELAHLSPIFSDKEKFFSDVL